MSKNLIDVILPTNLKNFNWLEASVNSVLEQEFLNKIIVSLDTDDLDQIKRAKNLFNLPNIEFISSEGKGVAAAINSALTRTEAEYIARQDDDDISLPNRFSTQLDFLQKNDFDMCFSSVDILHADDSREKNPIHISSEGELWRPILTVGSGLNHPSLLSKNFFNKENILYPENIHAEDYALWLSIANRKKIGLLSKSLYLYRSHNNQVTKQWNWSQAYNEIYPFWKNFCKDLNLPDFLINKDTFNFVFNIEKTHLGYLGARDLLFELLNQLNQFESQAKLIYLQKIIIRVSEIFDFKAEAETAASYQVPLNLDEDFQASLISLLMKEIASLKSAHDELGRIGHELQLIRNDLEGKLSQAQMPIYKKLKKYLFK